MSEKWRIIESHPSYSVSDWGRVRNDRTGRILSAAPNNAGYRNVSLYAEGIARQVGVHVLVAEAFLGASPSNRHEPNHKNGDKLDNRPANLEWTTRSENLIHAYRTGLAPGRGKAVRVIETSRVFPSARNCAKELGLNQTSVTQCVLGHQKSHRGLHFELA